MSYTTAYFHSHRMVMRNSGAARLEYQNKREEVWRRNEGAAAVEVRRKTKLSKPYAAGGPSS